VRRLVQAVLLGSGNSVGSRSGGSPPAEKTGRPPQ
jgi:hypothetical protein